VINSPQGVCIEVQGDEEMIRRFATRLEMEKPGVATIAALNVTTVAQARCDHFEIRDSVASGTKNAWILPDIGTCSECVKELFDPRNRRYRYPFINCTHCGPRFSIIKSLPYDRPNTSMNRFAMCADCMREYLEPNDRRFHAQPNACPKCGPRLALWNGRGEVICADDEALEQSADAIRAGVFDVTRSGGASISIENLPLATEIKGLAVTLEPKGGVAQPTNTNFFVAGST